MKYSIICLWPGGLFRLLFASVLYITRQSEVSFDESGLTAEEVGQIMGGN